MRNNAAVASANSHGISDNLRTFILDLDQAQTPGNYSVQLGKATLSSPVPGDSQGFAAGKKLPFRPDPFIGIAIIAAFAMIGSSLRRQKTRETGPNL